MATKLERGALGYGVGGTIGAVGGALGFGGGGHHTQMQSGHDFSNANPDDVATLLGTPGYTPAYDSNTQGSFEGSYNNILNNLTSDQLIKRYSSAKQSQLNTPLDQLNYQAYSTFKSLFGRDPTGTEIYEFLPAFQGPNGLMNGRAFLANKAQEYKSNPALDPMSPQNTQKPGDIQGSIGQQFQSILGRPPTADELQHFTQAIQTNQTDAYGLGSFLKQMPEYTNAQDAKFRSGLNTELSNYDTTEFNREKGGIMADYQSRGMAPGTSPSLDYALTDLMGKIASNRSAYLANLSASQYGGNKDLATGNYQNTLNQMYSNHQGNMQGQRAYGQQLMNQGFQGADYNTQMNNLMQYMNGQNQSRNVLHTGDYLNLGLNAVGTGAKAYSYLNA